MRPINPLVVRRDHRTEFKAAHSKAFHVKQAEPDNVWIFHAEGSCCSHVAKKAHSHLGLVLRGNDLGLLVCDSGSQGLDRSIPEGLNIAKAPISTVTVRPGAA